jgi:photosystem II stability/assembly factor-like uncharacterized protein
MRTQVGPEGEDGRCTFSSANVGWFLHDRDLWKTEDGGKTWRLTSALDALTEEERVHGGLKLVHFRNENHGCVITCPVVRSHGILRQSSE